MQAGTAADQLAPLEASFTGIRDSSARQSLSLDGGQPSGSQAAAHGANAAAPHASPTKLRKLLNKLHESVSPELSLHTPLSFSRQPSDSAESGHAIQLQADKNSAAQAHHSFQQDPTALQSSISSRRKLTSPTFSRQATSRDASAETPISVTVVDNDFLALLTSAHLFQSDAPSQDATPRNSSSSPRPALPQRGSSKSSAPLPPGPRRALSDAPTLASRPTEALESERPTYPPRTASDSPHLSSHCDSASSHFSILTCIRQTVSFVSPTMDTSALEAAYQRQSWTMRKASATTSSAILICLWITFAAQRAQLTSTDKGIFYGVDMGSAILMLLCVCTNVYVKLPWLYQLVAVISCWALPITILVSSYRCHWFYTNDHSLTICPPSRDYLSTLMWPMAYPVIHLFLLGAWRGPIFLGYVAWFAVAMWSIVLPHSMAFGINLINVTLFVLAIHWVSLLRERGERHMFLLSERVRRELKHTRRAQQLERKAEDSKQAFVSYIFHEVRVPLNSALLASENLEAEGVLDRQSSDHRDMSVALNSSLLTMSRVLNDTLEYQRMESGRLKWSPAPFSFHESIDTVVNSYRPFATSRKLRLDVQADKRLDDLSSILIGDPIRVTQIVSNLLSNACKHAKNQVQCRTSLLFPALDRPHGEDEPCQAALVRIEVSDDGDGIPACDLQANRLFSPYVQTETQLQAGGKGAGLGLALCRENVKLGKGRLGLHSKEGQGASFWVELVFGVPQTAQKPVKFNITPIVPPVFLVSTPVTESPPALQGRPLSALHIVVVDDDPLTCKLMHRKLSRLGHKPETAISGAAAITLMQTLQRVDLLILDGNLGDCQGWDCLAQLRAEGYKGYACGLTGDGNSHKAFERAGAQETLMKPISQETLARLISDVQQRFK